MACANLFQRLSRKKYIPANEVCNTSLDRCLNTLDLTALGIGSTLGLGIYVMAGGVAKENAGPSVILSFFIAAVASVFAGLCYAEFGARVPRAGSAYVYSYVTVGELIAFVIGWNLILEYVIGTASVASGYSGYINYLTNYTINNTLTDVMPMKVSWLSPYPDFLAFGITMLLAVLLSMGVEESSLFNNICTAINLMVVAYVIIVGSVKSDIHNWQYKPSEVPPGAGKGGFFPFGIGGMLAGAAKCFYGFVGFDIIATTGEEVKNPQRAIPLSIVLSLLFIFFAYFGTSTVLTLMVPYFDQNKIAPLPYAFDRVHWEFAKWFVMVGALTGLSTSLLGAMFPLPRVLYAMATDGLLFRFLAKVHPRFKTPFLATLIAGFFAAVMAMIFSVTELMDMMSIGTLMAYTLVAASVLMLRYNFPEQPVINSVYTPLLQDGNSTEFRSLEESDSDEYTSNNINVDTELDVRPIIQTNSITFSSIMRQYFNCSRLASTTPVSFAVAKLNVVLFGILSLCVGASIILLEDYISSYRWWAILILCTFTALLILVLTSLSLQPQNNDSLSFKVPLVPFIPALSIFINLFLMLKLPGPTWIRFLVWLIIGLLIYAFYGIKESSEEYKRRGIPLPQPEPANANVEKTS